MTDILTGMLSEEEFLEQSGVKGMKWGVIRDQAAAGNRGAQKKLDKADAKWEASSHGTAAYIAVHNKVADKMNNGGIEKFNANPKYKKIKDFSDESDPKVQEYYKDYEKFTNKVFAETVKETYGTSPSGRYSAEVSHDKQGNYYAEMVDSQAVTHADAPARLIFALTFDPSKGFTKMGDKPLPPDTITHSKKEGSNMSDDNKQDTLTHGMLSEEDFIAEHGDKFTEENLVHSEIFNPNIVDPEKEFTEAEFLAHTADWDDDDILMHYGKKGMKWGQRLAEANLGVAAKARTSTGNDKSRAAGRDERNAAIDAARGRVATGANKAAIKDAKGAYKAAKHTAGAAAAKAALRDVRDKNADDKHDAHLAKSGKEAVVTALVIAGGLALQAAAASR